MRGAHSAKVKIFPFNYRSTEWCLQGLALEQECPVSFMLLPLVSFS